MSRAPSARAPSPTYTAFSGISNYKGPSNALPMPSLDSRGVARSHFDELKEYLADYLSKEQPNSRATARQKLTRLTKQQFQELSTDVYDELLRRKNNSDSNAVPFLPVRDDFHPKRNQARQKLATLPTSRFQDLSSDVFFELSRRYPEFKDEKIIPASPGSDYSDSQATPMSPPINPLSPIDDPTSPRMRNTAPLVSRSTTRSSQDTQGSSYSRRKPSGEATYRPQRQSEDAYSANGEEGLAYGNSRRQQSMDENASVYSDGRRKQSRDDTRPFGADRRKPSRDIDPPSAFRPISGDRRRPSIDTSGARTRGQESISDAGSTVSGAAATAMRDEIVPTKSTITEEEIEIPFAREGRDSSGSRVGDDDGDTLRRGRGRDTDGEDLDSALSPRTPAMGLGGLADLSLRLGESSPEDIRLKRQPSDASDNGVAPLSIKRSGSISGAAKERIAVLENRIRSLENEVDIAAEKAGRTDAAEARVAQLEKELALLRQKTEEQSSAMREIQKDLDSAVEAREQAVLQAQQHVEDLQALEEQMQNGGNQADGNILNQLRSDMEGLLTELTDLSQRNDELLASKEEDANIIQNLTSQMKDYKRKYEQAKTELRSIKATSQLFSQATPQSDDQLPVSPDGGILDIHMTAFLSSIDSLLTAGRSPAPSKVLVPLREVVNSVTAVVADVRLLEERQASPSEADSLRRLCERAEATLTNLVAAGKTHATSAGMAPVSLLDAAASHVSSTITEMGKAVRVRRATKDERDAHDASTNTTIKSVKFATMLDSVQENGHQGLSSPDFSNSNTGANPPPNGRASTNGGEGQWTELKPYLEAQTDSVVFAIQAVLSGVRSATVPADLSENVTQIITIVTSVVAVSKDNLPPASASRGSEILQELTENANRLSEAQSSRELTKEDRQAMAKSSYAIANNMKELMKL